jgi:3-keto-disaccharide hydrolase
MRGLIGLVLALVLAPPPEADVQGLYEGALKDVKFEARVVATGKEAYKIYLRQDLGGGKVGKVELDGKTEGDAVTFKNKGGDVDWTGTYSAGTIKGTAGGTTYEMKRVERKSPTMGKKPPQGAIVLLDGKNFDQITKGGSDEWKAADDGSIQVPKGGMNSKQQFDGSFDYHVEFLCPFQPPARGQGRGNSGCYLPNGDEVQVLDSFGMDTYKGGGCGGLYNYKDPDAFDVFSLASLPPLEWQTYDMEYRVEKADGKLVGKPKITVVHNGIKIHDAAELKNAAKKGGFHWQDHGNPVRYRNIWVLPLDSK